MKKYRFICALSFSLFVLSACNNSETSTVSTSTEPDTTTTEPEPTPPAPLEMTETFNAKYFYTESDLENPTTKIKIYNFNYTNDIPYVTFEEFYKAFSDKYPIKYQDYECQKQNDGTYLLSVINYADDACIKVDPSKDTFEVINDNIGIFDFLGRAGASNDPFLVGYENHCYVESTTVHQPRQLLSYDFSKYHIDIIEYEDKLYFPFQILNDIIYLPKESTLIFNGSDIYEFNTVFKNNILSHYINSSLYLNDDRTEELAEYTYNEFVFFVENYYGLAKEKGYEDFDAILERDGFKENLLSTKPATYEKAMARVTAKYIADIHAGYYFPSLFANNRYSSMLSAYKSELQRSNDYVTNWNNLYSRLHGYRGNSYNITECYDDTYVLRFDEFTHYFGYDALNVINSYGDSWRSLNEIGSELLFYAAFQDIQSRPEIKNVIIDISLNSGGLLAAMPFLEAYVTPNPSFTYQDHVTGETFTNYFKVDINYDNEYDEKDTFAGKYNFYLLTSGFSFSCGNYLPTVIKEKGAMTLIGQKSGGGECVVGWYANASGTILRNSSHYHMGSYDTVNDCFVGNNNGIDVDHTYPYADFYNIQKLDEFIASLS